MKALRAKRRGDFLEPRDERACMVEGKRFACSLAKGKHVLGFHVAIAVCEPGTKERRHEVVEIWPVDSGAE